MEEKNSVVDLLERGGVLFDVEGKDTSEIYKNIVDSIHKIENLDIPTSQPNSKLSLHGGFFRDDDEQNDRQTENKVNRLEDLTEGVTNNSSDNSDSSSRDSSDDEDNEKRSSSSSDDDDRNEQIKNLNKLNAIIDKSEELSDEVNDLYEEFEVNFT